MSEPPTRRPTPAAWNAVHKPVELRAVAVDQVTRASPRTGSSAFSTLAGAEVGLWHMTAGGMLDVEVDEVFIVVDGEATLTLLSGDRAGESIALHPGVLCRLEAGQRTRWDVPVFVRKVYVTGRDGGTQDLTSGSEPR